MFSIGAGEIVIGLTRIPNVFLHQNTDLVQSCYGPVIITNCYWHYKHTVSKKTIDSFNTVVIYGSLKTFIVFELGWS